RNALWSDDAQSTATVLQALGAGTARRPDSAVAVTGRGALHLAAGPLDCGNSGTTARLMLGILAAHRFSSTLTGDASLSRRPMRRVTDPLIAMGATVAAETDG